MKKLLLTLFLLNFIVNVTFAQLTFQRAIGTPGNDRNYSIDKTAEGGYIMAGYTENYSGTLDIYVIKTDPYGNVSWSKTIGNSDNQRAWKIRTSKNGGYLLAGSSTHAVNKDKAFIIKLNVNGIIEWQTYFQDSEDLAFYGLTETASGSVVASGLRKTSPGNFDFFVGKVFSNGTAAFANAYQFEGNQESFNVIEDANGDYVCVGWFNNSFTSNVNSIFISKLDSNGNHLHTVSNGISISGTPTAIRGYNLIQSGRHYFVTGWAGQAIMNRIDTAFRSAASSQVFVHGNTISYFDSGSLAFDIKETKDNNIIIAGYTQNGHFGNRDAWLLKTSKTGFVIWSRNYGGSNVDGHWPTEVIVEPDKSFSLLSSSNTFGQNNSYDFYFVKTDENGASSCNNNFVPTASASYSQLSSGFHVPLQVFNATTTSLTFSDNYRSADVQQLCCRLRALSVSSMSVCKGATIKLGSDSIHGVFYEWTSQGQFYSSRANPEFVVPPDFSSRSFKLRVYTTDNSCSQDSTIFTLTLNTKPNPNFPRNVQICAGGNYFANAPNNTSNHNWRGPGLNLNQASATLNTQGQFILSYRAGFCTYEDTIDVQVNPVPTFNIRDTAVCSGTLVTLNGPTGMTSYNWDNTGESANSSKSYTTPGKKFLTVRNSFGCLFTDSFDIVFHPLPNVFSLPIQDSLCQNESRLINGPSLVNHTYNWNNGESFQRDIIAQAGRMYKLEITNTFGCVRRDSVFVPLKAAPPKVQNRIDSLCLPSLLTLDLESGILYSWNGVLGNNSFLWQGEDSVLLKRTADNGCFENTTIYFIQKPDPVFSLGNDTLICKEDSIIISGPAAMQQYEWNIGAQTQWISVKDSGLYSLKVTSSNGCFFSDSIYISTKDCDTLSSVNLIESQSGFFVYPNPSSGEITIMPHSNTFEWNRIRVFDIAGRIVLEKSQVENASKTYIKLNLSLNPDGLYYLKIDSYQAVKIIINRN